MRSDSSSESDDERLKEALDPNFLKDNIYNKGECTGSVSPPSIPKKPSLRNCGNLDDHFNPFNIKVTPKYQEYVSKQLMKKLDDVITVQDKSRAHRPGPSSGSDGGIRLLKSSKHTIDRISDEGKGHVKQKLARPIQKRRRKSESCSDEEQRAKQVAVSGEWVLSGSETKHWSTNVKGEVEIVANCKTKKKKKKKKSKTLVENGFIK